MTALSALGLCMLLGGPSLRAESQGDDVEELRRELKQARAQVQSLRAALSEAAEQDRSRAASLTKLLKSNGGEAPSRNDVPEAAPRPPSLPGPAPVAPSLPRRRAAAEATTGVVRGKVQMPAGEPVAYVYVENVFAPAVRGDKVTIEQAHKQFVPSWAVIQRGTTVEFPNTDKVYHNVFSPSSGNSFDLGLYNSASTAKNHQFNDPGAVDIFCNIHPQMAASILVVPNRHFAKVRPDGSFEINDVPGGKRKVVAWSPGSRLNVQWVELEPGSAANLGFKLEPKMPGHKNKDNQQYGSYQ
jgi:plastocyanin